MNTTARLFEQLKHVESGTSGPYSMERCEQMAPLVDEINRLKKEILLYEGNCYVHAEYDAGRVSRLRKKHPGIEFTRRHPSRADESGARRYH